MPTSTPRIRKSDSSLARVLASGAMARLVTHFVLHSDSNLHFRALQRMTGLSSRSLQHECARLEELGMIRRERAGRSVRYLAVSEHPRWRVLRELVREFAEPAEILRVALAGVPGVDGAFIYGSYARKTDIHPASDVDVFVFGETLDEPETRFALAAEALEAAGLLGREVNVCRYTPRKLHAGAAEGTRFLRSVLNGEKDWLIGNESVLRDETARPEPKAGKGPNR